MRLWVPADERHCGIASELAAKIAEHLGTHAPDAQTLGDTVARLASTLGNGRQDQEISFEFRQVGKELVIEARRGGEASEVRHRLPA